MNPNRLLHVHGFDPEIEEIPVEAYQSFLKFGQVNQILAFRTRTTAKNHLFVEYATASQASAARGKYAGGWQGDPVFPRTLMPVYDALAEVTHHKTPNPYRWDGQTPIIPELLPSLAGVSMSPIPRGTKNSAPESVRRGWTEPMWKERAGTSSGGGDSHLETHPSQRHKGTLGPTEYYHRHALRHTTPLARDRRPDFPSNSHSREPGDGRWLKIREKDDSHRRRHVASPTDFLAEDFRPAVEPITGFDLSKDKKPFKRYSGQLYSARVPEHTPYNRESQHSSSSRRDKKQDDFRATIASHQHEYHSRGNGTRKRRHESRDGDDRDHQRYERSSTYSHQGRHADNSRSASRARRPRKLSVGLEGIPNIVKASPRSHRMLPTTKAEDMDTEMISVDRQTNAGNLAKCEQPEKPLSSEPRAMRQPYVHEVSVSVDMQANTEMKHDSTHQSSAKKSQKLLDTPPSSALLPKKPATVPSSNEARIGGDNSDSRALRPRGDSRSDASSGSKIFAGSIADTLKIQTAPYRSKTLSHQNISTVQHPIQSVANDQPRNHRDKPKSLTMTNPGIWSRQHLLEELFDPIASTLQSIHPDSETRQMTVTSIPGEPGNASFETGIRGIKTTLHLEEIERLRQLYRASQAELLAERAAKRRAEDETDKERAIRRGLEDEIWALRTKEKTG